MTVLTVFSVFHLTAKKEQQYCMEGPDKNEIPKSYECELAQIHRSNLAVGIGNLMAPQWDNHQ